MSGGDTLEASGLNKELELQEILHINLSIAGHGHPDLLSLFLPH